MRRLCLIVILAAFLVIGLCGCPEKVDEDDVDTDDVVPPQSVRLFAAEASTLRVKLTWETPDEDDSPDNEDLQGILIVRAEGQKPNAFPQREDEYQVGNLLGNGTVVARLEPEDEEFSDESIEVGKTYFYEALTFDEVPNYSASAQLNSTPGSLVQARLSHTQTNLADGRVLLCGGIGHPGPLDTAELFDPETLTSRPLLDEMSTERFGHTATLLADGRVLLVGGYRGAFEETLRTAEIFDPNSESFGKVEGEMQVGRAVHTATLLPDGRVLIVGGTDGVENHTTMSLFDPATLEFTLLDSELLRPRSAHRAVLSGDELLIIGGFDGFEALRYAAMVRLDDFQVTDLDGDPDRETQMVEDRLSHTVTGLLDGSWLIVGGTSGTLTGGEATDACELLDFAAQTPFAATGMLDQARSGHASVLLADGTVLVAGGTGEGVNILDSAEIYDPQTGLFSPTGNMRLSRTVHGASLLPNGMVLITGGNRSVDVFEPEPASTAEIYDPETGAFFVVGSQ